MLESEKSKKPIIDLLQELEEAKKMLEEAERQESIARNNRCSALNRLNDKQKQVDAWYCEQTNAAPRDSHWKESERRKNAVPVKFGV